MSSPNFVAPPQETLHEHLDYFNDNVASGFDDIFSKDFDLLFDPSAVMDMPEPTPVHSAPMQTSTGIHHNVHQPQQHHVINTESEPIPYSVPSSTAPQQSVHHHHQYQHHNYAAAPSAPAMVTPPTVSKAVVSESVIERVGVVEASPPTQATSVIKAAPRTVKAAPASSASRKRSYSMAAGPEPTPSASDAAPVDTSNMSFQEQEDLRRYVPFCLTFLHSQPPSRNESLTTFSLFLLDHSERNRHHAKKSRQRKRNYMSQLEDAVGDMRKENERLFALLGMDSATAKAKMAREEERKATASTERFIQGLKQPRNRVLDNTTLAFLRELWK